MPATIGVVEATDRRFGDYQCNAAMAIAKSLVRNPRELAVSVVAAMPEHAAVERAEVAGPGFINITLRAEWLAERLEAMAADPAAGVRPVGAGRSMVIDYSSPNVAKPMHIGHIRSMNIGHAIAQMHRSLGYKVLADNHIGDWGTQFGILIMGYRHFADVAALDRDAVVELERIYVRSYERSREDEDWLKQCRGELVKLQAGDAANREIWEKIIRMSMEEFDRTYRRLGVSFDLVRGESHYNERLPGVVEELLARGIARESEGAIVVFLEEEKLPVCIVRKSDGGFNYATTDLATVESRVAEFAPDKIVYVTDERQQDHFRQVFAVCRRLGIEADLQHVWFGLMRLKEGTFSTRQGNVIKLDALLDEAERRAYAIVAESSPGLAEEQKRDIARAVGIGAVKYADLSQNPQTLVTFTWDKALALDGNSGPYLQYAYARIASVRDKYAERFAGASPDGFPIRLVEDVERELAVRLARFPEAVERAGLTYRPNVLTDYLYDLAQTYSRFYQSIHFLNSPEGLRESRVRLCAVVAAVLRRGLSLLGIETLERI